MRIDLGSVLTLVMGIIFIVFSEVVGRKINDVQMYHYRHYLCNLCLAVYL